MFQFTVQERAQPCPREPKSRNARTKLSALLSIAALTITNLLLCPASAYAHGGVSLWTNLFFVSFVDPSGNLVGGSGSSGLMEYSSEGIPLWTTNLYRPNRADAVDSSGNVFVRAGCWNSTNANFGIVKYSNSGVPLWTNCYNGPADLDDFASAVAVDSRGNVFVTGFTQTSGSPPFNLDYLTVAYSSSGALLWANSYEAHDGYRHFPKIAVDSNGTVFVSGSSWSGDDATTSDYLTIAYSSAGELLWINRYDGPANHYDVAYALAVDNNGNVFVTGESVGIGGSRSDFATIAYSNAGVPLWTNRYNGGFAWSIVCDSDGNVLVTGSTSGYATIKYSNSGVPLWTRRYSSGDANPSIAVDSSGNVFVAGSSFNSSLQRPEGWAVVAYSGSGAPLWTNGYNGGKADRENAARAIAVDRSGNVYVSGYQDTLTIKYSSSIPPARLDFQKLNNELVLSWTNAGFNLQSAPAVTGPFTNLPAATSPYTNVAIGAQQFFRLIGN